MDKVSIKLVVVFEDPFWIAIFERIEDDVVTVSKITFGSEPKDYEIYARIQKNYNRLRFSPPVSSGKMGTKRITSECDVMCESKLMKNKSVPNRSKR